MVPSTIISGIVSIFEPPRVIPLRIAFVYQRDICNRLLFVCLFDLHLHTVIKLSHLIKSPQREWVSFGLSSIQTKMFCRATRDIYGDASDPDPSWCPTSGWSSHQLEATAWIVLDSSSCSVKSFWQVFIIIYLFFQSNVFVFGYFPSTHSYSLSDDVEMFPSVWPVKRVAIQSTC